MSVLIPEIAVASSFQRNRKQRIEILLRRLTSVTGHSFEGGVKSIEYPANKEGTNGEFISQIRSVSITESRVAMIVGVLGITTGDIRLVVFDLKDGRLILVRWLSYFCISATTRSTQVSAQERLVDGSTRMGFVDTYRLLFTCTAQGALVMINTSMNPIQETVFSLHPIFKGNLGGLVMEDGAHGEFMGEVVAPFYPDPDQQVIMLPMSNSKATIPFLAFPVETLLRHVGSVVEWDAWKKDVVIPFNFHNPSRVWISGCRIFGMWGNEMRVHDLSVMGQKGHLVQIDCGVKLCGLKHAGVYRLEPAFVNGIVCGARDSVMILPKGVSI